MRFPNRETVGHIRREYPVGTRVELVRMDDPQDPPAGTKGTVGLNMVYGEDECRKMADTV